MASSCCRQSLASLRLNPDSVFHRDEKIMMTITQIKYYDFYLVDAVYFSADFLCVKQLLKFKKTPNQL